MKKTRILDHIILICGCIFMMLPVISLALTSTHSNLTISQDGMQFLPGNHFFQTYENVLFSDDLFGNSVNALEMLKNSLIVAILIAALKTIISLIAAYALVYFKIRYASVLFGLILISMFFPIETRILPTFLVTSDVGLLNSYAGMVLPITASGLGTLVFRQYYKQIPDELMESAKLDAAGPLRFLIDILIPISAPMIIALFSLLFVIGWNQYLWPLMINTTSEDHYTIVRGIERVGRAGSEGMALAVLAILPPAIVMLIAQRWIVRGLTEGIH